VTIPGSFYELNVHFGVFVGGMGGFTEIFLGNQRNFRGCLENVVFQGIDVLARAQVNLLIRVVPIRRDLRDLRGRSTVMTR